MEIYTIQNLFYSAKSCTRGGQERDPVESGIDGDRHSTAYLRIVATVGSGRMLLTKVGTKNSNKRKSISNTGKLRTGESYFI